jgi:hypothetical protein
MAFAGRLYSNEPAIRKEWTDQSFETGFESGLDEF